MPSKVKNYKQLVNPIESPNFFELLNKSKSIPKTQTPFKLTKFEQCKKPNKKCNKLYTHYVVTNNSNLEKLLDKTNTKKIKDYIKYLLKVQNETKKAKIDNHNLLVDIFLNKLYTSNQETYFKILNDESFLKSTLNPNLKGGYKTKRRKRSSRNKSMKKKTTAI